MAARRLRACCAIVVAYSLIVTAGLLIRYEAEKWGLVLSPSARTALVRVIGMHGAMTIVSFLLLVWARRRSALPPLVPKLMLSIMPLLLLVSIDGILSFVIRPPYLHSRLYIPHATRDWAFRPGSEGAYWGEAMRVNSRGLPGPEVEYAKDEEEYRVLILGDSVTAGYGVPEEACLARQVSKPWRADGAHDSVTTVNCSVVGYSPWQQADLLEKEGLRYDPDVIVHVFCLNDYVQKFSLLRFGGVSPGEHGLAVPALRGSGLYRAACLWRDRRRAITQIGRDQVLARYAVARMIEEPDAPRFDDAWRITLENMAKIAGIAKQHGKPFAIVCLPYAIQLDPGAVEHPAPQARLAEFARTHSVPFLDLLPLFRSLARERGLDTEDLFLDFCHPTVVGHALAADAIRAFLIERGLLPPEPLP